MKGIRYFGILSFWQLLPIWFKHCFHSRILRFRESHSSQTFFVLMARLTLSQASVRPDLCLCLSACSIHPWSSCQLESGRRSNSPPYIVKTALKAIIYWYKSFSVISCRTVKLQDRDIEVIFIIVGVIVWDYLCKLCCQTRILSIFFFSLQGCLWW